MTIAARARYWFVLLPLVSLLGATYWLNMQIQTEPVKITADTRLNIDALMENFSATKMDGQGRPHFIVSAKRLHHYMGNDSTTLDEPEFTTLSEEGVAIRTTARHGRISSKGDEIFLQDNVAMLRGADNQQAKLTLETEYLHILPNQNLMTTDHAVTITGANTTVHAVGLEIDYKLRTFRLLSQVKSIYVPAQK